MAVVSTDPSFTTDITAPSYGLQIFNTRVVATFDVERDRLVSRGFPVEYRWE